jgi:hypothetical protein
MKRTKCLVGRGVCPTYIGEGAAAHEGCGQPSLFLLFMVVVRNPLLHGKVTPSSNENPHFNFT